MINASRIAQHPLLSYAFRPFFLGHGLLAIVAILLWLLAVGGTSPFSFARYDTMWHGHEMLFGFALSAVAGFMLTAVATWTGRAPVRGWTLLMLFVAWIVGRVVMIVAWGQFNVWWSAAELMFPGLLAVVVGREIVRGASRRNYVLVVIVIAIALADLCFHVAAHSAAASLQRQSLHGTMYLIVVLVSVIAGRIIPSFTSNWLRARQINHVAHVSVGAERTTVALSLATGVVATVAPHHSLTAVLACLSAIAHLWRMARWRGFATVSEPLLFVLHVAYAWLPIGFALLALSIFWNAATFASAVHAFTMGGIGAMTLSVTSRVALGHTGRALRAAPAVVIAYVLLNMAVLVRVASPFIEAYWFAVGLAGSLWIASWMLFVAAYTRVLMQPRRMHAES